MMLSFFIYVVTIYFSVQVLVVKKVDAILFLFCFIFQSKLLVVLSLQSRKTFSCFLEATVQVLIRYCFLMNIWQAWHVLSSMQISSRNYVKPGRTVHVKDFNTTNCQDVGKTTLGFSAASERSSAHTQTHQYFGASAMNSGSSEPTSYKSNNFPSNSMKATEPGKSVEVQSQIRASTVYSSNNQVLGGSVGNLSVQTRQLKESKIGVVTDIDDDDDIILEVILFARSHNTRFEGFSKFLGIVWLHYSFFFFFFVPSKFLNNIFGLNLS